MFQTGIHRNENAPIPQSGMDQFLASHPQWRLLKKAEDASPGDGALVHTVQEVFLALSQGVPSERIFFPAPFDRKDLESLFAAGADSGAMCRFIAGGSDDLKVLEAAAEHADTKELIKAGLRIRQAEDAAGYGRILRADGSVAPEDLASLAQEIRKLCHVTVLGCFFCADLTDIHGAQLGRYFRAGYETAKRMTVTLPCAMPYLCFEGAASALLFNANQHPETLADCLRSLEIMTTQNETAFYARLFLN